MKSIQNIVLIGLCAHSYNFLCHSKNKSFKIYSLLLFCIFAIISFNRWRFENKPNFLHPGEGACRFEKPRELVLFTAPENATNVWPYTLVFVWIIDNNKMKNKTKENSKSALCECTALTSVSDAFFSLGPLFCSTSINIHFARCCW